MRKAGCGLRDIGDAMRRGPIAVAGAILRRVGEISRDIARLKALQSDAIHLLGERAAKDGIGREDFEKVLEAALIKPEKLLAWHIGLAEDSPGAHEELMALLRQAMR